MSLAGGILIAVVSNRTGCERVVILKKYFLVLTFLICSLVLLHGQIIFFVLL